MGKVFMVTGYRTPVGKFLGGLSTFTPGQLMGELIRQVTKKNQFPIEKIDEVIVGNVLSAGQGQNIARQAALLGGLSATVPAYTVNMVCGSGLKTFSEAYAKIKAEMAQVVLVGGVEVMSQAGFVSNGRLRGGQKLGDIQLQDVILRDGLTDALEGYHMGETAENLANDFHISREEQDTFSLKSHQKATDAQEKHLFDAEILPIMTKIRGREAIVAEDEHVLPNANLDKMSQLKPAFLADGTVTAGNASGINDGAAVALLVSEKFLEENPMEVLAEVVGFGQAGVSPDVMGLGPVEAIDKALKMAGISFDQIENIELNEAFAAQSIAVIRELSEKYFVSEQYLFDRTNVQGGAIAIGHPIGASGARLGVTLAHQMVRKEQKYGLASLCIGGGMGIAMILKGME